MTSPSAVGFVVTGLCIAAVVLGTIVGLSQETPRPPLSETDESYVAAPATATASPALALSESPRPSASQSAGDEITSSSTELIDSHQDNAGELEVAARAFLRADLTGQRRNRFGAFWGQSPPQPCCRELEILAVNAFRHAPRVYGVSIAWSARRLSDAEIVSDTTIVWLKGHGARWRPLHSWEVAKAW